MVSIRSLQSRPVEERQVGAPLRGKRNDLGEQQSVIAYYYQRFEAWWRHTRMIPSPALKDFGPPLVAVQKKWPATGRPLDLLRSRFLKRLFQPNNSLTICPR